VAGTYGVGGGRVLDHVEEVSEHGLELARALAQIKIHHQSRVTSFV